ncbi:uncharacterized protein LOC142177338 [Nicotiana tabacum]|uniref:Uncharacterized protein LOC142177338 n=1 Tax=Nicotiana tabacum TaxID=4097 RepID=A0AC58TXI9_TOBAC
MHDFIMAEDSELWDVICDGPYIPMKNIGDLPLTMPKTRKEYTNTDRKAVEKNFRAKKILEIWEALQIAHEGTTQVKQSKIDMLTTEYELFRMKDNESIQDTYTRFTSIINELYSLGEIIPRIKLVRKILSILPSSWESKVNAITEAKDLQELTIDELKMVRRNGGIPKRGNSSKPKNYDFCHKCGKPGHFIKDYPFLNQEHSKYNLEKAAKRNPVPDKHFKRKRSADNMVKRALASWGDSSSESEDETDACDSSMMAVESDENEYNSIFALMAQSDDDEDDDNSEVNFRDVQRNLKSYSPKKLMSLASVLIDVYHSLVEDKNVLTLELGEAEQTRDDLERDDLLIVIVDLRETIEGLRTKSTPGNSGKGKEVSSEAHIRPENELKALKTSMCVETEKNKHLQTKLERVKSDLEKSLKWTWSSEAITAMYVNNGGNRQRIRFQREKTPYNPHIKYVTILHNWLCTHCGNNGHFKENCQAMVQYIQKNKVFAKNVTTKKGPGNNERKQSAMIYDKGNKVEFLSNICTVTNLLTGEVVLVAKRYKNIYIADFKSIQSGDLSCLKAIDDDDQLGKVDAKSDEGIFLGYSSQSKAYKIYNKWTQCVEESVHVIFDESYPSCKKNNKDDQDGEPLLVPGEVIDMTNGKVNMMSQMEIMLTLPQGNQVPRACWYERLSKFLLENGFTRGEIDNTLFMKKRGRNLLIVQFYVDDIIFGEIADSLCENLQNSWEYIKELLKRFDMEASKVINTHIATATRLDMDEVGSPVNQTMYKGIVGSLLYLPASRPDIVFSVGLCEGYLVDRKSTSGMTHFLGSCLNSWGTRKQNSQLEDFGVFTNCVPLLCNNTNALNMSKNPIQHKRTKHIDVRHHFLRDNMEKGLIYMKFYNTEDQIADIFTKALSMEHFIE